MLQTLRDLRAQTIKEKHPLTDEIATVLREMFADYMRVVIHQEFTEGYSDSRVFLVQAVRPDRISDLPYVVKVAEAAIIEQEKRAYDGHIRGRLPRTVEIQEACVMPKNGRLGGIRSLLVGFTSDIEELDKKICNLGAFLQTAVVPDIKTVLQERLFTSFKEIWQQSQTQAGVQLKTQYDFALPPNIRVKFLPTLFSEPVYCLSPHEGLTRQWQVGDFIEVVGFVVKRVSHQKRYLLLDLPGADQAYHLYVEAIVDIDAYEVNQVIEIPLQGVVVQTRAQLLTDVAEEAVGHMVDVKAEWLTLPHLVRWCNPLWAAPRVLDRVVHIRESLIHGDLHLKNILLEIENNSVYIIDFAESRFDHAVRDLVDLEVSVLVNWLPDLLEAQEPVLPLICRLYTALHCAWVWQQDVPLPHRWQKPFTILLLIRQAAPTCLLSPDNWQEYYQVLFLCLLGAFDFDNGARTEDWSEKERQSKQMAFWAAAMALRLAEKKDTSYQELLTEVGQVIGERLRVLNSQKQLNELPIYRDTYSRYERGAYRLLQQLTPGYADYDQCLTYQQRLGDNIALTRRYGDTETRRAERAEVIGYFNRLALSTMGQSFNELCS